jgi:hypothetical protein
MPIKCRPLPTLSDSDIERFWQYVQRAADTECWLWTGNLYPDGYGQLKVFHRSIRASRVAYRLHYGIDPYPLFVLHHCDTPACCNGVHLFRGTNKQNMEDAQQKGRVVSGDRHHFRLRPETAPFGKRNGKYTHPESRSPGEKNGSAKLTEENVMEIRSMYRVGQLSQQQIADLFGINQTAVSAIISRKTWSHLPPPTD